MQRFDLTKFGFVRCEKEEWIDELGYRRYVFKPKGARRVKLFINNYIIDGEDSYWIYADVFDNIGREIVTYNDRIMLPHYNAIRKIFSLHKDEEMTIEILEQFYKDCLAYDKEFIAKEKELKKMKKKLSKKC